MSLPPVPSQMADPTQLLMQQMAQQANTTGLTSMQTAVPNVQVRQPAPFQPQQKQSTGPVGPGQGPWKKQVEQQNFVAQVQNMAGKAAQVLEQRKARVQQQTFDQFTTAAKGLNDAQGQLQTAQQQIQQATAKLQADPNDAQAKQTIAQATQQLKSAQQAVQQNQTVINDIANDPKKSKLLQKGFGIDDKNAKTPERAQAIASIKKSTGVGDNAANILGRLPQTQQLTPQAQGQAQAHAAGVTSGQPATQGQLLTAAEKMMQDKRLTSAQQEKLEAGLYAKGFVVDRGEDGKMDIRAMTTEERSNNPVFAAQDKLAEAKTDAQKALTATRTDPNNPVLKLRALEAQSKMISSQAAVERANTAMKALQAGDSDSIAQMLVDGDIVPSQLPKRGNTYVAALEKAGALAKSQGKDFSPSKADSDFSFAKNNATQNTMKYLNSLTGKDNNGGNLGVLIDLSDKIKRSQYPALNDALAWGRLKAGDPQMAAYYGVVVEVADQVAKIMQGGSSGATSDAKMRQASELFAKGFNPEQVKGVATQLRTLLGNRKKELIGDNKILSKEYGTGDAGSSGGGSDVINVTADDMK